MTRASVVATVSILLIGGMALASEPARGDDGLAAEIDRWSTFLEAHPAGDETWKALAQGARPVLGQARSALSSGRRLLALQRLLAARSNLAAAAYVQAAPASGVEDLAGFEAEWARMGGLLGPARAAVSAEALAGVRPAALRALGEAALPQARVFYDASLEYGRSTAPEYGLFYLGSARAAAEAVELCRSLAWPSEPRAAPVRSVPAELEALEGELLAAYRPPLAIDRHPDFIAASSLLKEARELDAAGLRHGGLLRYLQAAQRFAPLRPGPAPAGPALAASLAALEARLSEAGVDHSLGRLFLEHAREALAASPPDEGAAQAIAAEVLPRYFAALQPARPAPRRAEPRATVTLVRWPYT